MLFKDCQAILGLGVLFTLLGIFFILWNRRERERKGYYDSLVGKRDLREFLTHEPERPWLNAWQIGGRVSLTIGIVLLIAGGVLWLILY
jgi:hypothetical protein